MKKNNKLLKIPVETLSTYVSVIQRKVMDIEYKIKNIKKEILVINNKNRVKHEKYKTQFLKERDTRHYAPASKEWNNSVYTFNKNYLSNIAIKDQIASGYIKSYFNMTPLPFIITKSKRMRDLIKRSSTKQLFVSKPEIKQTNDKAIVNLYTYDRERKQYFIKLFSLRKWLNESLMGKKLNLSNNYLIRKFLKTNKKYRRGLMYRKRILSQNGFYTYRKKRNKERKHASRFKLKSNLYLKIVNMLLKKKSIFINKIVFKFIRYIYEKLNIKIKIVPSHYRVIGRGKNISRKTYVNLIFKQNKKKMLIKTKQGKMRFIKVKPFETVQMKKSYFNSDVFKDINVILMDKLVKNYKNLKYLNLVSKFHRYKNKSKKAFSKKYLKKEILIIEYLSKLYLNKFKFHTYLPGLKNTLSKIYNKKIQLNLINLKYLQLNSDMFSEAISIKLRKRTKSLYKLLRKSFNLVKTLKPNEEYINTQKKKNSSSLAIINTFIGKQNVLNGNIIRKVFKNMFNDLNLDNLSTSKEVLRSIKYKWVTGARIEAKGRLTKRYAASRALFKYKYRGALRNLEYLNNVENKFKSSSVFMLRGEVRPNTQYSLIHSKRRIGAFGIKGWISNS